MIEKEVAELRRRIKREHCNISHVFGCYVSEQREIVSTFDQSLTMLPEDEQDKYYALLRKVLTGTLGKNLVDISFSTKQVLGSEEHRLLSTLRSSALKDADALGQLYDKIIASLSLGTNYVILLAEDVYDVPYRSKDGAFQDDAGDTQHTYLLCAVCPVKLSKPGLRYEAAQREFHNRTIDQVVSAPELGFTFPAFDDRRTNLYGALYYCRDASADYAEWIDAIFHTPAPMPAGEQQQTFGQILTESLAEECNYSVVQSVHEQLSDMITAHKEAKVDEPLTISRPQVDQLLQDCGVTQEHMAAFHVKFDEAFGHDAAVSPRNLIEPKRFELRTPDVVIRVNPERQDLIETRTIGGVPYILIKADEGVSLNGVDLSQHAAELAKA